MSKHRIIWNAGEVLLSSPTRYRVQGSWPIEQGESEADNIHGGALSSRVFDLSDAQRARLQAGSLISPQGGGAHEIYADTTVTLAHQIERTFPPAFDGWREQLLRHAADFPSAEINAGLDWLLWGKTGAALILRNNTYSIAWRKAYAGLVVRGALDTRNADQFLRRKRPLTTPTSAISWVSTDGSRNPAQLNLANAVAVSGSLPSGFEAHDYALWAEGIVE